MPIYELRDKNTGEIFEKLMSISAYEQYLKENPHIERYFSTMHFMDEVAIGRKRPPEDFQKYVIERIKKNNPGHKIESRWDTPREW